MAIIADVRQLHDRIISHTGPASYVQKSTTGDPLQATEAAMKNLYHVEDGLSGDGLYAVEPINPTPGPLGAGATSVPLVWVSVATGLEVNAGTNLSASTVALRVVGV